MKIRVDDTVLVVKGRDRGKRGKVVRAYPESGRVQVEGVNVAKRHAKASANLRQAGIIDKELPLRVENVVLVCPTCSQPCRFGRSILADGSKGRICKPCGEIIE